MKSLISLLILGLFTVAPAVSLPQQACAAEKPTIILSSTPFGTGSYALASAFEAIVNKNKPAFNLSHTETPGQAFNIQKLNKDKDARKNTIAMAGPAINWLAERGKMPFKEKMESMYLIGTINVAAAWLATDNKDIKSVRDLAGKRIALGRVPQVVWGYEPDAVLRQGFGDIYKQFKIQFVGTNEASTALLNGQVDACVLGGYLEPASGKFEPSPQTVEILAASRPLNHLDWGKEAVEKTIANDVFLTAYQLPANSVAGMDKPIWVFTDPSSFVAHKDFPEELAYLVTKTMIQYVDQFADYHALGKLVTKKGLIFGWPVERIHPGSLRAFKEAGIL